MRMNQWENKNFKVFPGSTITAVNTFHHDDEYGKRLQGAKDCVSVSRNMHEHEQNWLRLCNLKELNSTFEKKYPYRNNS